MFLWTEECTSIFEMTQVSIGEDDNRNYPPVNIYDEIWIWGWWGEESK